MKHSTQKKELLELRSLYLQILLSATKSLSFVPEKESIKKYIHYFGHEIKHIDACLAHIQ